ncbi:MAG TPA: hypothetical protein VKX17_00585 [Planctomycetota bacterium]|nr:hypothetical protein [Planctomycetota bacterium]
MFLFRWSLNSTGAVSSHAWSNLSYLLSSISYLLYFTASANQATQIAIAAGDGQTANAGAAVSGVVCVIAKDSGNNPVEGVTITWGSVTGGGSITGETQMTGSSGIATLGNWTLGNKPGANTITATSPGLNSLVFTATGTLGPPAKLAIAAGDGQTAAAGTAVKGVVCASVKDAADNPIQGIGVTWGLVSNNGSIAGAAQNTGSDGIATLGSWTLGKTAGTNTIVANAAGLPSITFTATGIAGPAALMSIAAGNNQTAPVGTAIPNVVCAFVGDQYLNPVAGVTVTWGSVVGGGSITGETQQTNASGIATLGSWTLGPDPGLNTITATAPGVNSIAFNATGAVPARMAIAAGNNQFAPAGSPVLGVVCVIVTDQNNNAISGTTVTWGNVTGGGSITGETQQTNASGIATLGSWTLGLTTGMNTVTATSPGLNSITFVATATPSGAGDNAVIQWDIALLSAIQNTNTAPPIAARAMAITHTAIFDAWAAYDATASGTQLGGTLRRPVAERTTANKQAALSFAAYRALLDLFPSEQIRFDNVMIALSLDSSITSTDTTTPEGIGNTAAAAIISFRHGDGSNQLGDLNPGAYSDYTSYAPLNDPDTLNSPSHWQPLRVNGATQTFLAPQWGLVTPFAIGAKNTSARTRLMPKKCATYPGMPYTKQAQEILDLSAGLNDQQKSIASYWADGAGSVTPPGHWCQFAQFISQRDTHTLDDDVKMFFALSNAMLDASIEVWDCKRRYDSIRPISAVHFLFNGKSIQAWAGPSLGTQTIQGDTWQAYIPTPPFPEYVSGHSTFSAAGAQILASFTGSTKFHYFAVVPSGSTTTEPDVPAQDVTLSWSKFLDAANEAGMSRRYGGIHFKDGDMQGRALGKKIGQLVWKKAQGYFAGK